MANETHLPPTGDSSTDNVIIYPKNHQVALNSSPNAAYNEIRFYKDGVFIASSGVTHGASAFWYVYDKVNNVIPLQVNMDTGRIQGIPDTPASAAAAGTAGEITWDDTYIYICTATNTWKRALAETW
jgi:hypothetical protein